MHTSEESTILREELGQPGMGPPASPELQQQPLELVMWKYIKLGSKLYVRLQILNAEKNNREEE